MTFSSNVFLYFYFPLVLGLYFLTPRKWRNALLFAVNLFFYGWGEPIYIVLMVLTVALDYGVGLWIGKRQELGVSAKLPLVIGVVTNLLLLAIFKYASPCMQAMKATIPALSGVTFPEITLPIGISFYVFQSMSYFIDVYRREVPAQKNLITFGTYVTLFPQLIAGPIVRYRDVEQQLISRRENLTDFAAGIRIFVIGLAKKVLLANQMGAFWQALQGENGAAAAWIGIAAYTLQIYFDFSGYSDMAIGLGRMLGFEFLINFNYPYIAKSITDFWRRWHISLSTWFKEYVYIPLGGNRKGLPRQILNLLIVWGLTGIWHGANWNFLLWGLYYGALLILEKVVLLKALEKLPAALRHLYTIFAVMLGWALFYFEDTAALGSFFTQAFTFGATPATHWNTVIGYLPLMAVAAVAVTPLGRNLYRRWQEKTWMAVAEIAGVMILLLLCVSALASQSYNPFIYFKF